MKNIFTLSLAATFSLPVLAEDQFSLGTGFDFSSGKYGNTIATDMLYVPVTGKYETDDLTFKITVPYLSITGPGGVTRGIGRFGRVVVRNSKTTNAGLGDITSTLDYAMYSGEALSLDLVGNVKFGTADAAKGLGTGANDYSVQIDGYYSIGDSTVFATAGYKKYGSPSGANLNDVPYGTLGMSQKLTQETSVGVMADVAESASTTTVASQELTLFLSQKIGTDLKVQANLLKGFSTASADIGGGLMLTYLF